MDRQRNAYGRDEKCIQNFGLGNQYKGDHLGDRCRQEDNIKMDLLKVGRESVDPDLSGSK